MPVYNADAFLNRSMDSVRNQTYRNWELLVVDDGSTDHSRELVQQYCAQDPRIKLLCNQHGGTARARNTAITAAEGAYFAFIDADDVYHPRYLELLVKAITQNDVKLAVCGIECGEEYHPFVNSTVSEDYNKVTMHQAFSMMYGGEWPLMISPWNKLYARRLFETIRFPDGRYFEDAATVNLALYNADPICILNAPLYFYYVTPNSSSKTKRSVELQDREWALRSHWEFFFQEGRKDLAYLALPFYLCELISIYHRIEESDKPEDCQLIQNRFFSVRRKYGRFIHCTQEQKDIMLRFANPKIYDIRNMICADGVWKTGIGFIKRKLSKKCK